MLQRTSQVIVVIGTLIDECLNPSLTLFARTVNHLAPHLRAATLIVLRSTVYPGTTAYVAQALRERDLSVDVAFCPERIAEGHALEELGSLLQIIGADDSRAGADVVAASRYMRGGRQIGGPRLKRLMSRLADLTLHWFGGIPIHDPTSNFKLYNRRFLDAVAIESRACFELALELSVTGSLADRHLPQVLTTWRIRTAGRSRFRMRARLPHYLRSYLHALGGRWRRSGRR